MNTIDLDTASSEILQACEDRQSGGRLPYFFLVGAGISSPPVKLAYEIQEECKTIAQNFKRTDLPQSNEAIDQYSHWFDKAYPNPIQRQRYLRNLIAAKPISAANFRLAHLLLQSKIANLVVTTNFDDFLARALTLFGKQYIVCDHPETVVRIDPEERDDIQIVHVHGSYWFYDCCNLRSEIAGRARHATRSIMSMLGLLEKILWRRMPLVIGYGGWEGDVVMTALQRRLSSPLPYRLYWFCYRHDAIASLPRWLKSNENVYFVVPEKPAGQPMGGRLREDEFESSLAASTQPDVKTNAAKGVEEIKLAAQQVLDKLILTFNLTSPKLTSDPLGYFADYLRSSLPHEEAGRSTADLYSFRSVIERIEKARSREEDDRRALHEIESRLEDVRDALRRSQYQEAIMHAREMSLQNLSPLQLKELGDAVWSAATLLADNSEEETQGYDLVVGICDVLAKDTTQPETAEAVELHQRAATALAYKGITLGNLDRRESEIATYNQLLERFGAATNSEIRAVIGQALINKGLALGELKRDNDELAAYDEIIKRYAGESDPTLREHVMNALYNKEIVLSGLGQFERAISACDQLIERFNTDTELNLREGVAQSLINKARYLVNLNKQNEAFAPYDEVVKRFDSSTEGPLREQVATALYNKANLLGRLNQINDALFTYDQVVKKFDVATELGLREKVAKALYNKAYLIGKSDQVDETAKAVVAYDEVVKRFGEASEPSLRQLVATALYNKANLLNKLDRVNEAVIIYDEVVKQFGKDTEPGVREQVRRALNNLGFTLLCEGKREWATGNAENARLKLVEARGKIDAALGYDPQKGTVLGNKGYVAFLLGEEAEARELLTQAFAVGGEVIRKQELDDSQIHPLPQDKRFRELIGSIPVPGSLT